MKTADAHLPMLIDPSIRAMHKTLFLASMLALAAIAAFSVFSCSLLGLYLAAGIGLHLPLKGLIAGACTAVMLCIAYRSLSLLSARLERLAGIAAVAAAI